MWSRERIEQMLREDDFSYQNINLPYGLSTGGADRSATIKKIFPDDMTGKSVLDLGAKYGYFCFEALKRGASHVVGVDVDPDSVRKARMLADCLGVNASFELLDIEVDLIREHFDYVLCLNLLHHLRNPLSVLEKLASITRERLILEVAALGRHDRKKIGISPVQQFFLNRAPVIVVNPRGASGKKSFQKFFLTSSAVEHLLLYHRFLFARVDTMPSEHKGRYISIAHKRKIDNLVVVAGPTAVGKSTLVAQLKRNELPDIARRVGIEDGTAWLTIEANKLYALTQPYVENLLFHYDFLRSYLRTAKMPGRDEVLDVLDTAEHLTFLTLWCPPEILQQRLIQSEIEPHTKNGIYRGKARTLVIAKEYENLARVREHYQHWFAFTRTKRAEHLVVSLVNGVQCYSVAEWEELAHQ
jgi:2-polyprenyl-3-methyl-5-hydroxy-6-metoxy-1,4-benzoquinol methylase